MVTQQQAVDWLLQQQGKSLDADGKYGAQCVDLIFYYFRFLGIKWLSCPSAKDIWFQNWPADQVDKIDPRTPPQPGDVGVWGATTSNADGHTFGIVGVSAHTMDVVDQNYVGYGPNGSPAARHPLELTPRLLGFIRPHFAPNAQAGSKPGEYTIQKGDTFYALEQKNGWPNNILVSLNPGQDPRKLQIGQKIIVPGGELPTETHSTPPPAAPQRRTHTVVNGENLSVIAAQNGVQNWRQIYDIPENKAVIGPNPSLIQPGQVLILP